ncbi:hypothetical protein BC830DRAFT_1165726 [Chytriomyces sp. MP71]|nr:hypothetical protein BC830DRAFT_1165726 [Chytriomyces sp. MP71]
MSGVQLAPKQFHSRARTLLNTWSEGDGGDNGFAGADSVVVVSGLSDENEAGYQKTSALQVARFPLGGGFGKVNKCCSAVAARL